MKFYSDLTKKPYDTEKECLAAEAEYKKEQAAKEAKQSSISKEKRELSKAIEDANDKLKEANKLYEVAQSKAKDLLEKSNKEIKEILDNASKVVKEAQERKLNALIAFNKKFGTYTTTITGEEAAEEFNDIVEKIDKAFSCTDMFKNLLSFLF